MGCTNAKLSLRDVFEDTRTALGLDPQLDYTTTPPADTVAARAELFAYAQSFADAQRSGSHCHVARDGEPTRVAATTNGATAYATKDTMRAFDFLRFVESRWRLSALHPLHCLWPTQCALALMSQRSTTTQATVPPDHLSARDVRTWMMMTCEGVHVLALLEETKALPKAARKALTMVSKQKRPFPPGQYPATEPELQKLASTDLVNTLQMCGSVAVTPKDLNRVFLQRLAAQMPTSLTAVNGPGQPVASQAVAVISGASSYWKETQTQRERGLRAAANPLAGEGKQAAVSAGSGGGCCGGGSPPAVSVPLMGLVEWLCLRLAFSYRGTEENACLYTSSLPDDDEDDEDENGHEDENKEEDVTSTRSTPLPPPSPVVVKRLSALEHLAWLLKRLYEIEAALASGAFPRDERVALEKEKAALEAELQALFDRVAHGESELGKEGARDGLYEALGLAELFPKKAVHDGLSDCAYECAIGYDAARDRSDAPSIQNLWRFRLYLTSYLALNDLYADVVTHHGVAKAGDAVDPLAYDTFFPVLQDVHARDATVLDGIPVAGDHQEDQDTGRIISLFQRLAKMAPGDERTNHFVDFAALCQFVAQRTVEVHMTVRPPLRPLDELRRELRIAQDNAEGEKNEEEGGKETLSLQLLPCAARMRELLQPLPGEDAGATAPSQIVIVDTLVAQASLFQFTYSAAEAAGDAVAFSALVERTLQPTASDLADDARAMTGATAGSSSSYASWLALARDAKMPIFASLVCHSLYGATCVYRCVSDTQSMTAYDAVADAARFTVLTEETPLDFEWFLAALTYISDAVGLEPAALVANASNVLEARDAMLSACAPGATTPSTYSRTKTIDKTNAPAEGDDGGAEEQDTEAPLPSSSAHVTKAFMEMTRFGSRENDNVGGRGGSAAGRGGGGRGSSCPPGTVRLGDVAYVCVFHYTCKLFGEEPILRLFFSSAAYSACETRQLDADDATLRGLLAKMPLGDAARAYAEFFALSAGARAVCLEDEPVHEDEVPVRQFCAALFARYSKYMVALKISEEDLLKLCRDAIQCVGTVVEQNSDGEPTRKLLFAKDYQRFLQYIAGTLLAHSTYGALNTSRRKVFLDEDGHPTEIVDTTFVRRLLFFLEQEQGIGGFASSLDADEAFTGLLQKDLDLYDGAVSLQTAADWYGDLRATQVPPCVLDWWSRCAGRIPWTHSAPHREGRRALLTRLAAAMCSALGLSQSDVDPSNPWASLSDGYLPRTVLADTLREQYPDLYWAATVMQRGSAALPTLSPSSVDAGDEAASAAWWADWVAACMAKTNTLVSRDDLADAELNVRDVRLLLTYMHHHATVFFASGEAQKEVRAMRAAAAGGATDQQAGETDACCCYSDATFQRVLKAQLERLLGSSVSAAALAAAMAALQAYGSAHPEETVNDDVLAHLLASALVQHTEAARRAEDADRAEEAEAARLKEFEKELFLGTMEFNDSRVPCGTYWERLRLILPSGNSQKHRRLRREIFQRMDVRRRGYLTMSDIYQGALDVLHLEQYRADVLPVLFRAFFAAKETEEARQQAQSGSTGDTTGVVYLDSDGDRILLPQEFRMFLGYVYRYMELYFMFDALTASERVDGHTLHVIQTDALPSTSQGAAATGVVRTTAPVLEVAPAPRKADETPYAAGDALFLAAEAPYRLTAEAANMPKEVTQSQFASAHRVLRHWGVRVRADAASEVFLHISRRCREQGSMYFTAFAIWASEHNLRPEGYAHDRMETLEDV